MAKVSDFTFEIKETNAQFQRKIRDAIRDDLNIALPKIRRGVEDDFAEKILKKIYVNSPEYDALLNGPLNQHFGFRRGTEAAILDGILSFLQNAIKVRFKRVAFRGSTMIGGLKLTLEFDYDAITNLKDAILQSTRSKRVIPWLKWLVEEGDKIIIKNWKIVFGSFKRSASGNAVMVYQPGAAWRVPPAFSGTVGANWFTRMFNDNKKFIEDVFARSIDFRLSKVL